MRPPMLLTEAPRKTFYYTIWRILTEESVADSAIYNTAFAMHFTENYAQMRSYRFRYGFYGCL